MELEMDCLTSRRLFSESLQLQIVSSAPMYDHLPVFKACLSISFDGWAKCKEKVPNLSDSNQIVERRSHSKLKFT